MTQTNPLPSMPDAVGREYARVRDDLHVVQVLWQQFEALGDEASVAVLNKVAPGFFALVQISLFESVVLGIGRLLDSADKGERATLSFDHLVRRFEEHDKALAGELAQVRDEVRKTAEPLLARRHKFHGHRDYKAAMGERKILPVPPELVRQILEGCYGFISRITVAHTAEHAALLGCGDPPGNAGNLLTDLRALAFAEERDPLWVPRMLHAMGLARAMSPGPGST